MEIPVRIVLVEPTHPGNIGAVARAMKTMGLADLALVRPRRFPDDEALARASGADDVLAAARVCESLAEAISDCGFVVGTSARLRALPCPVVNPRRCAELIVGRLRATQTAVVMGTESSGLTNEQMAHCRYLVNIPASAEYSSLNLAMATQVICYELRMAVLGVKGGDVIETRGDAPATAGELEGLHAHLERVLDGTGFFNPDHPKTLRLRLRRLFHRAELDRTEVNILRGALAALDPERRRRDEPKE
ncbi:MAG: RNA methyltransferase [Gammaproteobacteria bacterium]